jgi:hypothetical protein
MAKLPALAELIFMALKTAAFLVFCWAAYKIRLHAIEEYGRVIHEFDPWFNFRATEVRSKPTSSPSGQSSFCIALLQISLLKRLLTLRFRAVPGGTWMDRIFPLV